MKKWIGITVIGACILAIQPPPSSTAGDNKKDSLKDSIVDIQHQILRDNDYTKSRLVYVRTEIVKAKKILKENLK